MSEQAIFAAKLLAGEMPNDIEDAFNSARVSLFPSKNEIETDCSCPDWANPCKHIAAVYYLLGERFDEDPFFIFLLRGRSKDEVMEMLRQRRSTVAQPSEKEAKVEIAAVELIDGTDELANDISFWNIKEPLDKLQFKISDPEVSMGIVKRLGNPPGWNSKKSLSEMLEPYYEATKAM